MTTRRLAAILAADVVGFSKLIGEDEAGTLNRRDMNEDILTAAIGLDETKALLTTESLHRSFRHRVVPYCLRSLFITVENADVHDRLNLSVRRRAACAYVMEQIIDPRRSRGARIRSACRSLHAVPNALGPLLPVPSKTRR
jgi:hypothetical protein